MHPQAWVAPTAQIGQNVAIYPFAYVGDGASIGDGTTLHPGAVIGDRCRTGKDCTIHPHAVLYAGVVLGDRVEVHAGTVLGGDGFGYRQIDGRHVKVPHTGRLEIDNDVEIGSNCTIDRATFETSRVGEGTKIDNLVMIGHNNQIGRHNSLRAGWHRRKLQDRGLRGDRRAGWNQGQHADRPPRDRGGSGRRASERSGRPERARLARDSRARAARLFQIIARLPEMYRQLRELSAQLASLGLSRPQPSRASLGTATRRFRSRARERDQGESARRVCRARGKPIGLFRSDCSRAAGGFRSSLPRPRGHGLPVACVGIKYEVPDELRVALRFVRAGGHRQARRDDPGIRARGPSRS